MAMARARAMVGARVMSALLLGMVLLQVAQAAEYEVGNQLGWTIPSATNYFNRWTVGKTYYVGDKLKFVYNPEMHNVMKVGSVEDYHSCTMNNPESPAYTDGATLFTLDRAGDHFFICSIPTHCDYGMKLAVRAVDRNA